MVRWVWEGVDHGGGLGEMEGGREGDRMMDRKRERERERERATYKYTTRIYQHTQMHCHACTSWINSCTLEEVGVQRNINGSFRSFKEDSK